MFVAKSIKKIKQKSFKKVLIRWNFFRFYPSLRSKERTDIPSDIEFAVIIGLNPYFCIVEFSIIWIQNSSPLPFAAAPTHVFDDLHSHYRLVFKVSHTFFAQRMRTILASFINVNDLSTHFPIFLVQLHNGFFKATFIINGNPITETTLSGQLKV